MAQLTMGKRLRHIIGDSFGAALVEMNLEKAVQAAKEKAGEPQTVFYDPMTLFMGQEWLNKRNQALTANDLRTMAKNPIIGSIIQTRINQMASFCYPQGNSYDYGYQITSDDPKAKKDIKTADEIEGWIYNCGIEGYGEKLLETFVRKFMRDSLILDQACAEVVFRRNGLPAYMVAVDAATIRLLGASLDYATPPGSDEELYVQIIGEDVKARYTQEQLIFGIRNPTTDLTYVGYGTPELEILVRVVTAILNTERYNSGQVTQGGTQKGVLIVKGEAERTQFESFKRDFREAIRNAGAYWRAPVLQVGKDADVNWVTLDRSNRDMEYAQLFEFLVKQACGLYQMEPSEINWQIGHVGATTNFEARNADKIQQSQRRGLKPLLTFLSNNLNFHIIKPMDPRFRIEFVGLDADRAQDSDIKQKEVTNYKTVNEVRVDLGLDPIEGGDIILNQFYMQGLQLEDQRKIQAEAEQADSEWKAAQANGGADAGSIDKGTPSDDSKVKDVDVDQGGPL